MPCEWSSTPSTTRPARRWLLVHVRANWKSARPACSLPLCGGLGWCGEIRVAAACRGIGHPNPPKVPPKPRSPRFHRLVCEEPTRWPERLRSGEIAENEMHNGLMTCAACGRSLAEDAAWKGSGERYYCNEFCADAEAAESRSRNAAGAPKSRRATEFLRPKQIAP